MLRHWADWFALRGEGYNFWSGIGSDLAYLGFAAALLKHLNCHTPGCWRLGHHHLGGFCRRHTKENP